MQKICKSNKNRNQNHEVWNPLPIKEQKAMEQVIKSVLDKDQGFYNFTTDCELNTSIRLKMKAALKTLSDGSTRLPHSVRPLVKSDC